MLLISKIDFNFFKSFDILVANYENYHDSVYGKNKDLIVKNFKERLRNSNCPNLKIKKR